MEPSTKFNKTGALEYLGLIVFSSLIFISSFYTIPSVVLGILIALRQFYNKKTKEIEVLTEKVSSLESLVSRVKSLETKVNNQSVYK